ncbi:MAG: hypothetical protein AB7R89_31995 [Dehalococcoidia bacterium]
MSPRSRRRRGQWFIALTFVVAAAALWTSATSAQELPAETPATPTPAPSPTPTATPVPAPPGVLGPLIFGAGTATLGENFPTEYRGDQIFVAIHARTLPSQSIGGVFTVAHHKPNGDLLAEVRGEISCLRVEGDHALVTGVITSARTPGLPEGGLHEGVIAGIIVRDGGGERDRMAWTFGEEAGANCDDLPIVTVVDVEYGNFVVHD